MTALARHVERATGTRDTSLRPRPAARFESPVGTGIEIVDRVTWALTSESVAPTSVAPPGRSGAPTGRPDPERRPTDSTRAPAGGFERANVIDGPAPRRPETPAIVVDADETPHPHRPRDGDDVPSRLLSEQRAVGSAGDLESGPEPVALGAQPPAVTRPEPRPEDVERLPDRRPRPEDVEWSSDRPPRPELALVPSFDDPIFADDSDPGDPPEERRTPPTAGGEPDIVVRIGRLNVRAVVDVAADQQPVRDADERGPGSALNDYLRASAGRR